MDSEYKNCYWKMIRLSSK